jgi:AAA domain
VNPYARRGSFGFRWSPGDGDAHPSGLRQSRIPLTIVCGAPCSGKSRLVDASAAESDLVIDLDAIASRLAGTALHAWRRRDWLTLALKARNDLLMQLGDDNPSHPRAWLVVGAPYAEERQWWWRCLHPERIVVLETPQDICLDRLFADQERATYRSLSAVGIHGWWQRYTRRLGDEVPFQEAEHAMPLGYVP